MQVGDDNGTPCDELAAVNMKDTYQWKRDSGGSDEEWRSLSWWLYKCKPVIIPDRDEDL